VLVAVPAFYGLPDSCMNRRFFCDQRKCPPFLCSFSSLFAPPVSLQRLPDGLTGVLFWGTLFLCLSCRPCFVCLSGRFFPIRRLGFLLRSAPYGLPSIRSILPPSRFRLFCSLPIRARWRGDLVLKLPSHERSRESSSFPGFILSIFW